MAVDDDYALRALRDPIANGTPDVALRHGRRSLGRPQRDAAACSFGISKSPAKEGVARGGVVIGDVDN